MSLFSSTYFVLRFVLFLRCLTSASAMACSIIRVNCFQNISNEIIENVLKKKKKKKKKKIIISIVILLLWLSGLRASTMS